ncbi:SPARC-related modular calcium-binding protein 2 isoform X2 [Eurytemora carolleeae]|uniref:SPARC-related modular calcium-binding protein 2 isoform X2 n=1 Tax=Eurytemora carolleeae TaxID=1294199 RepID=UPI000C767CAA|nr:SPARC-related modular calcium-binding protein 2 isoform X2 [Eurytemora carolleeae]|eukprot:XP_023340076.1 SPARC-related modular calcium-binding protein 2-like isoform X2 [Eurytemora affinis]
MCKLDIKLQYRGPCQDGGKNIMYKLDIKLRYRGPCQDGVSSRCLEERQNAVRTSSESGIPLFVPDCLSDGSYNEVQCHKGTGYCWCVNDAGKPVPGTSVRYARPSCRSAPDSARFRRGRDRDKRKGSRATCTQADRSSFNSNLKEMISTEHRSMFGAKGIPAGTILGNSDQEVMEWKFSQLDEDRDGVLKNKELKQFKEDIRKVLRPRGCSRTFTKFCDMDSDRRISKQEWRSCSGLEENFSFKLFLSLNSDEDEIRRREERERKRGEERTGIRGEEEQEEHLSPDDSPSPSLYNRQYIEEEEEMEEEVDEEGDWKEGQDDEGSWREGRGDCKTEREEATKEARAGNEATYIPECDRTGEYNEVQCYKSTGYCWCVEKGTGRPVPGTSSKHHVPDCTKPSRREWLKCEGVKRDQFLSELKDWFRERMDRSSSSTQYRDSSLSSTENSIMWKFSVLDRNKDGVLKRKEIRAFKGELRAIAGLKLCGKRINKYCDLNLDKKISIDEWKSCLNQGEGGRMSSINPVSRRRGPNPLKTWLKGD